MKYLLFSVIFLFLTSCSQTIKVYDGDKLLATIDQFSEKDTMISIKDFYITYKKSGKYLEGKVESNFSTSNGSFKAMKSIEINLDDKDFWIREK